MCLAEATPHDWITLNFPLLITRILGWRRVERNNGGLVHLPQKRFASSDQVQHAQCTNYVRQLDLSEFFDTAPEVYRIA